MTWVCKNCGNDERFEGTATESTSGWREMSVTFDNEGGIEDWHDELDSSTEDSDLTESDVQTCESCGSDNIEDMGRDEYDEWKQTSFGPDGKYKKDSKKLVEDEDGNIW